MRAVLILIFLTIPLVAILVFMLFFQGNRSIHGHINPDGKPDEAARTVAEVKQILEEHCIKDLDPEELTINSVKGMLKSIPYSNFEQDSKKFKEDVSGKFTGIGIICKKEGEKLIIGKLLYGSKAYSDYEFQPGDEILQIDDFQTEGLTVQEVQERLKGEVNTLCRLHVRDAVTRKVYEYKLYREVLALPSVSGERIIDGQSGIGYVHISKFQMGTGEEFKLVLQNLDGKNLKALIIDLRFNSGGLLDIATKIANIFIADGVIVETQGKDQDSRHQISAQRISCLYPELDLVVLINGSTTSAAEMLAGALQDHERAKLVGTRSFGKGVVQTSEKVQMYGKTTILTYPSAFFYLPSGRCIDKEYKKSQGLPGLGPDETVKISKKDNTALKKYIENTRRTWDLMHAGDGRTNKHVYDPQLEAAIRLLKKRLRS